MVAQKESRINLLPKSEFESSTVGRIFKWLLSSFRIIVIVTELIVMAAFLSRFWLDAKSADLNDSIRQKQAVITFLGEFEDSFRQIQEKLKIFKAMTESANSPQEAITQVASSEPSGILLSNFTLTSDSIQIKGTAASEGEILQFIKNLKSSGKFKEISLDSLFSGLDYNTGFVFVITVTRGANSLGGT